MDAAPGTKTGVPVGIIACGWKGAGAWKLGTTAAAGGGGRFHGFTLGAGAGTGTGGWEEGEEEGRAAGEAEEGAFVGVVFGGGDLCSFWAGCCATVVGGAIRGAEGFDWALWVPGAGGLAVPWGRGFWEGVWAGAAFAGEVCTGGRGAEAEAAGGEACLTTPPAFPGLGLGASVVFPADFWGDWAGCVLACCCCCCWGFLEVVAGAAGEGATGAATGGGAGLGASSSSSSLDSGDSSELAYFLVGSALGWLDFLGFCCRFRSFFSRRFFPFSSSRYMSWNTFFSYASSSRFSRLLVACM